MYIVSGNVKWYTATVENVSAVLKKAKCRMPNSSPPRCIYIFEAVESRLEQILTCIPVFIAALLTIAKREK